MRQTNQLLTLPYRATNPGGVKNFDMKKLIFLLALMIAVTVTTSAQGWSKDLATIEVVTDTVTDTGTEYANFNRLTQLYDYVLFATADKLTGTVTGTITLQVSPDGDNWITHPTADTLTYTNVSDGMLTSAVSGTDLIYPYMRAKVTGSGTSTSIWTLDLILKK